MSGHRHGRAIDRRASGPVLLQSALLGQALADSDISDVDLAVVTDRLHPVLGQEAGDPLCATALGPTRVIPKEMPSIICRNIDVDLTALAPAALAVEVINEHCAAAADAVVADPPGGTLDGKPGTDQLANRNGTDRVSHWRRLLHYGRTGRFGFVVAEHFARASFKQNWCSCRARRCRTRALATGDTGRNDLGIGQTDDPQAEGVLESLGAEILTIACDVTQADDLRHALAAATAAQFGPINGVIHAAGIVDDAPFLTKTRVTAGRVLARKVRGPSRWPRALQELCRDPRQRQELEFVALFPRSARCSHPRGKWITSPPMPFWMPLRPGRTTCVSWQSIGDLGRSGHGRSSRTTHPLLARRLVNSADELSHAVTLQYDRDWVLSEHRLAAGRAVLPGTGYLEMACAALVKEDFAAGVEFEDVFFVAPFFAEPGESREAYIHLHRSAGRDITSRCEHEMPKGPSMPPDKLPSVAARRPLIDRSRPYCPLPATHADVRRQGADRAGTLFHIRTALAKPQRNSFRNGRGAFRIGASRAVSGGRIDIPPASGIAGPGDRVGPVFDRRI